MLVGGCNVGIVFLGMFHTMLAILDPAAKIEVMEIGDSRCGKNEIRKIAASAIAKFGTTKIGNRDN